jgi:hypothetical protein
MNIIELQERLKDLPEQSLMQEMQMPSGTAPQFLVLSELKRRKRMRDEYQRQEAQGMQTVAEEAVTGAGMPAEGIMQMSRAMAPQSAIAQNTGVNDMMQQESVRAPQPEQPMMMADGGVLKMQPGGFTDRQQQGYLIFLQQMGLQDSPESQEMYMRMMERQAANPPAPEFFMRGMEESPQGLAGVSADISDFLPGMPSAEAAPPMMSAPPALGPAPGVGTVDFDASVAETAPALEPETDEAYLGRLMETADARSVRAGLAAAPSGLRPVPTGEGQLFDPEASPLLPQVTIPGEGAPPAGTDLRGLGTIIGEAISGEDPEATANRLLESGQINQDQYNRYIFGSSGERNEIIREALGYQEPQVAPDAVSAPPLESAELPRPVESQDLSFGLDGLNIPGSGTPLSFGGVTPSAADIPLSTGEAATGEPTPEFPLGTPATVPGTQPVADRTGGSGTGGGGAGDFGPIESRIARMLEERERSAQADKWLSLAQTGLALMASDQPTLGGAIGEAGLAGIGALQQARSQYDKDIMELLDMQAGVQRARASGARSASTGGLTASNLVSLINNLTNAKARIANDIATQKPDPTTGEVPDVRLLQNQLIDVELRIRDYTNQLNRLGGSADVESGADFDAAAS